MFCLPSRRLAAVLATVFTAAALLPAGAGAAVYSNGTSSTNFDVTMTIVANCVIGATPLSFGTTQGVLSAAIQATSTLNVTCSNTTPYNIGLDAGNGTGSSGTTRYLSGTGGNTGTVRFNLFQTLGATLWGNTQGTDTRGGVGNGAAQALTVYGEVPAQATPLPDAYKSTITATVYF